MDFIFSEKWKTIPLHGQTNLLPIFSFFLYVKIAGGSRNILSNNYEEIMQYFWTTRINHTDRIKPF